MIKRKIDVDVDELVLSDDGEIYSDSYFDDINVYDMDIEDEFDEDGNLKELNFNK